MIVGTLVDSNVILDVFTGDPVWSTWSTNAIAAAAERGPLVINPMIYAEVSVRFTTIEELDDALPHDDFLRVPLPWDAAFLAGKAYLNYRKNGGARTSPLPDLFIGAHAAVAGLSLLTRDRGRYATCFPTVHLDTP